MAKETVGRVAAGAPIVCKIAVKPTPSIALAQSTVDLARGKAAEIRVMGRHAILPSRPELCLWQRAARL